MFKTDLKQEVVRVKASPGDIIDILVRRQGIKPKNRILLSAKAKKKKQAEERESARRRKKNLREQRLTDGICIRCGIKPHVPNRQMCLQCGLRAAELNKDNWIRKKLQENYL
jgi:ribosomal protein L37E